MRTIVLSAILLLSTAQLMAQKYITRNGHISFFSEAPMENIEAHNHQVSSIIDVATGEVVFSLLIKGFQFEKALMQEHFNEKYMESDRFPKSTFSGRITNLSAIDWNKDGAQQAMVEGELMIHGVTKQVASPGTITMENGKLTVNATFPIRLADYGVEIPSVVKNNIAEVVDVTVSSTYEASSR